ncbi:hypothetical protein Salat_0513800 [Sesamum alatum]|uniref:Uncharacterized protein n=1 Tax=Sesamum alatum TaxID=300844 RepID=A0AAE1Z4S5_9LAMI|nr:hypothetical protein Salat_0513800 [Sesamum alatum]
MRGAKVFGDFDGFLTQQFSNHKAILSGSATRSDDVGEQLLVYSSKYNEPPLIQLDSAESPSSPGCGSAFGSKSPLDITGPTSMNQLVRPTAVPPVSHFPDSVSAPFSVDAPLEGLLRPFVSVDSEASGVQLTGNLGSPRPNATSPHGNYSLVDVPVGEEKGFLP